MAVFATFSQRPFGDAVVKFILGCVFLTLAANAALADTRKECEGFAILQKELDAKIRACTSIIARNGNAAWAYENIWPHERSTDKIGFRVARFLSP